MQGTLFGREDAPSFDAGFARAERIALDALTRGPRGAWLERVPGWVAGHEALFARLERAFAWRQERRPMYERVVDVPRLLARVPGDGDDPILHAMAAALSGRYGVDFDAISLAIYRDGADSVAWHRDKELRDWPEAFVAVASLGGTRRFMVRPLGGGPSRTFSTGWGDLLVMGGTCQRTFEHAVPKQRHADPRMALMFRHSRAPRGSSGTSGSRSPRG